MGIWAKNKRTLLKDRPRYISIFKILCVSGYVCVCLFKDIIQIKHVWIQVKAHSLLQGIYCLTIFRGIMNCLFLTFNFQIFKHQMLLSTSKFLWVLTVQIAVVAKFSLSICLSFVCFTSYCLCNHSFSLIYHIPFWSWLHYLPIFVMVHWYITNTIKPFTILRLLANTSQLQGWKNSDITSDISSSPFIGSVQLMQ